MEFINRSDEMDFFKRRLFRSETKNPAFIVIRSPSGFGKSRLTHQLCLTCQQDIPDLTFCIVDTDIQVNARAVRLHDGFFLQRCAEQLSRMAASKLAPWLTFTDFLKSRRWMTIKSKRTRDLITDMPGWSSAYKHALDYMSRGLYFGRFSPEKLLSSDEREAISICMDYVNSIISTHRLVLVIREMQHCDIQSLRTLLEFNEKLPSFDLIAEYTSSDLTFDPAHQKLLSRFLELKSNFEILDLIRLNADHLEHLIRTNVDSSFHVTTDAYLSWSGNLHSVLEMKFQVGISRNIVNEEQMRRSLADLPSTIFDHIGRLSSSHRLILAISLAHFESIPEAVLLHALNAMAPSASIFSLKKALGELVGEHKFLDHKEGMYRIHIEAVASALRGIASIQLLLAGAQKALRDYYCKMVFDSAWEEAGMSVAVRQVFRLCAQTKDVVGLSRATEVLSAAIAKTHDQSLYAEIVADAISSDPDLYAGDHDKLVIWAASLAYDVGSYECSENLLALLKNPDAMCSLMRACALQEIGRHKEALHLASTLREKQFTEDACFGSRLVEALILGCMGEYGEARQLLMQLIQNPSHSASPLIGYAHRFFEVTEEHTDCIDQLRQSIAQFERFGMQKSKAYSQAAAAVLVARSGDISSARSMVQAASTVLIEKTRDRHLLLNNIAAIELLSDKPDYLLSIDSLTEALRYVRDDYCEVTVLNNLAIALAGVGGYGKAVECVDKMLLILSDHDFASRDVYWPVCFNAAQVMIRSDRSSRAQEIINWCEANAPVLGQNKQYWAYRYRRSPSVGASYKYLADRPFHPLYLSHWLIDLDGLSLLKQAPPQSHHHNSSPSL